MKDKNGVEIKVGDTVEFTYRYKDKPPTRGVVTEVTPYTIWADWEDTGENQRVGDTYSVTVIGRTVSENSFTEKDEKLLQELMNRKEKYEQSKAAENELRSLCIRFSDYSSTGLFTALTDKYEAEQLIRILKQYHNIT